MHSAKRGLVRGSCLPLGMAVLSGLACGNEHDMTQLDGASSSEIEAVIGQVRSGLRLVSGVDPASDVAAVHVTIAACGETEALFELDVPLGDDLPTELLTTGDLLRNSGSEHIFADAFQVLEPGCYDLVAAPVTADGAASAQCAPASESDLMIQAGQTAEALLLLQCAGTDRGVLDGVAAVNHPPEIVSLDFHDENFTASSKFICGTTGGFCALAADPDEAPFEVQSGIAFEFALETPEGCTAERIDVGPSRVGCFDITCAQPGRVDLQLTLFDLGRDGVRIEDLLAQQGSPGQSRAELSFPMYLSSAPFWPDADDDGFGDANASPTDACEGNPPPGFAPDASDCNDGDASISPAAPEVCGNGLDDDCNGEIDEPADCPVIF